eukprot:CAMPEP_0167757720 /NCGR_PEP_ID=MMETSP0110_2-20121227/10080_1 /TAXON_ID=629695 /ORGANISM="Gymnochlora sp., Strain CCMP2014" /LENGTH=322 /DNA_ID=CAMNT_0007643937 /DNA_START=86 /DNA_END=1054 /DNA_ORIENTATION=-
MARIRARIGMPCSNPLWRRSHRLPNAEGVSEMSLRESAEAYISRNDDITTGVYTVFDGEGMAQYVGYSEDVAESIRNHLDVLGNERCSEIRLDTKGNLDPTRARIQVASVVKSLGSVPPGNSLESWKWSLKKPEDLPEEEIISPFVSKKSAGAAENADSTAEELTLDAVDKTLEEIRPMLIKDGGNVKLMSVDDGVVSVRLEGACASCTASAETMQYGVEDVLRKRFGDNLKEVQQIKLRTPATTSAVNTFLGLFKPALEKYKGDVLCVSMIDGRAILAFKGPDIMYTGVKKALEDRFPEQVVDVERVEWDVISEEATPATI